ncbi:ryanodine receptor 1-like [Parus major]|uniref:ryanodine receptor 1-like n=1 Tax=Parus major TaxID=9157 RepID=UPI0007710585|nr:ryanodine receptor 1-like [Parus major]
MGDIGGLAESGARYTEMPHVIEVTLPMLCHYLPRWWERGPDAAPQGPWATEVTGQQLNALLGHILRIVVNNLGIDEASWMKRLAGEGGCGSRVGAAGGSGGVLVVLGGFCRRFWRGSGGSERSWRGLGGLGWVLQEVLEGFWWV